MRTVPKKISILSLIGLLLLAAAPSAQARPVSYAGGWMAMTMNDSENDTLSIDYSPASNYSVGYTLDYWRQDKWLMNAATFNWLAKRWNGEDMQANLYLLSGLGTATSDHGRFDGETELAGWAGMEFDAENRKYYFSYENNWTDAGVIDEEFRQKAKVGFAPYVAEYGSLHTWIILQVDHRPHAEDELVFTPMLRFFKGDYWLEVGVSDAGNPLVNFSYQF